MPGQKRAAVQAPGDGIPEHTIINLKGGKKPHEIPILHYTPSHTHTGWNGSQALNQDTKETDYHTVTI